MHATFESSDPTTLPAAGRPLRIAFIGARGIGAAYSGIETYYEEVGARLVAAGHEVLAYCRRHATPPDTDFRGVTPIFRPCVQSKHGETFTHTLTSTLDVLARRVDLVQYHALGPALFAATPRLRGVPTVASIRGLDWQREKWGWFAKRFLRTCESLSHRLPTAVSVVSKTLQEHYEREWGVSPAFIPNGVNLETAPPPKEIRRLGLAGRDYFLFMGRISPEKGCETLIDAYRRLDTGTKLVIAGGSSYTDAYLEGLKRNAPPGVIFPGRVSGRLRDELYGHSAAFVLPSTMEGLSVALLEAMAFGSCVVTSDIPENRELVDGTGWTFPLGDAEALCGVLQRVLQHPDKASELGSAARRRVETTYTWDMVARETERFYYAVLARGRASTRPLR
jgi:glycosyltransferase involved in cell wall biosynthesis